MERQKQNEVSTHTNIRKTHKFRRTDIHTNKIKHRATEIGTKDRNKNIHAQTLTPTQPLKVENKGTHTQ